LRLPSMKRNSPTSASPPSISSTAKTSAPACSWLVDAVDVVAEDAEAEVSADVVAEASADAVVVAAAEAVVAEAAGAVSDVALE
jgi:hypothetical protein